MKYKIFFQQLDHAGWKDEGLLDAVLEEIQRRSKDEETYALIEKLKKSSIQNKKEYILENAPFSLLTAGWGQEEEKREKKKEKREIKNVGDETFTVWRPLTDVKNPKKVYYLIFKK